MLMLHSIAVPTFTPGADAVQQWDLAVNPLSVVLLKIAPLNDTGTLANFVSYLEAVGAINRFSITWRGQTIVSASGRDLAALAYLRHGCTPWMPHTATTNNDRVAAVLPVFLGRRPFDGKSCFPKSRAGDLQLELDYDIADTGYDGLTLGVETIELLGAEPSEFERKAVLTRTFAATGDNDVDLPMGNSIRGALLWGTTEYTGAAPAPSWGRVGFRVDGVEMGIARTDWEVLFGLPALRGLTPPPYDNHVHITDVAAAYTQFQLSSIPSEQGSSGGWENYALMDLDPLGDDAFSIDTKRASRVHLRAEVETADAVRVLPIERVKVSDLLSSST